MSKFDNVMMDTAIIWAKQSYCKRRQVGAILAKDDRIISNGYNGTVSGSINDCEDLIGNTKYCSRCNCKDQDLLFIESERGNICTACMHSNVVKAKDMLVSKGSVIHAEANAILFAAKNGISTDGCTLYVTLSPCIECAKMIIQSGINRVVYLTKYRVTSGIDFLIDNNIDVLQIKSELSDHDSFLRSDNISVNS